MPVDARAELRAVQLVPGENVRREGNRFVALTREPWLEMRFTDGLPAGRWISLTYRSSYFDVLVRPLLRFVMPDGTHDQAIPAALFGRAEWVGRVPEGTRRILISPVDSDGAFGFEIEGCRQLSAATLLTKAWSLAPRLTLEAVGSHCIGRRQTAHRLLHRALGWMPLEKYHEWRGKRLRDLDLAGLDAPRADWSAGSHIRIAVAVTGPPVDGVRDLLGQLEQQPYPSWSLALLPLDAMSLPAGLEPHIASGRLVLLDPRRPATALLEGLPDEVLVGTIRIGDSLPRYALATLAEWAMRQPAKSVFYADDDTVDPRGRHGDPRLKPDWSPTFEAARHYVGAPLFVRGRWLVQHDPPSLDDVVRKDGLNVLLAAAAKTDVEHIRRVMLTRPAPSLCGGPARPTVDGIPAPAGGGAEAAKSGVTIIIPNRDQPRLLEACMRGLGRTAGAVPYEVIIVDNGSVEAGTRRLYNSLQADNRVTVIDRPGPFNFARMCNDAAGQARMPILLFLNNDIEMVDSGWLEPLLSWASRPDIGAVGAKLLYPSGGLQHGGVVVGLAGSTAHVDRGAGKDDPGYLQRLGSTHEVSAVTGACLAVERAKFNAVGGFDAQNLPVELNDIDMCLRLEERGWRTIFTPQSVLIHHESASRGTSTAHSQKYERERAVFRDRWSGRLRDDPYFHPALSLVSIRTALG